MQIFCSFYPQNKQIEGIFLFVHRLNKLNGLFFFPFSSSKISQNNPQKPKNYFSLAKVANTEHRGMRKNGKK